MQCWRSLLAPRWRLLRNAFGTTTLYNQRPADIRRDCHDAKRGKPSPDNKGARASNNRCYAD